MYPTSMTEVSKHIGPLVTLVRSGEFISKANDSFYHLWNIQGYAQGLTIGYPTGTNLLATDTPEERKAMLQLQDLKVLEKEIEKAEDQSYGAGRAKGLNILNLITIAKTVIAFLKELGIFDEDGNKISTESNPAG